MNNNIPQDVLDKIEETILEKFPEFPNTQNEIEFREGAIYGYQLRDDEVKKLKNFLRFGEEIYDDLRQQLTDAINPGTTNEVYLLHQIELRDKRIEELSQKIKACEIVLRVADVPKILIEFPELLQSKAPTLRDIEWAKEIIKKYESALK